MQKSLVIAADVGLRITAIADIAEVFGQCYGKDGLLLTQADLTADFFDLQTGIAGELFQKCTNYQIQLALVVTDLQAYSPRIAELAFEHRHHRLIRFFESVAQAKAWLEA